MTPEWFPHDVPGWLSLTEGTALAELADGKVVLEIGSYCGRSTVCLAQKARQVFAVDTFDGRATPHPGSTYLEFEDALNRYKVVDRVTVCPGVSTEVVPQIPTEFDVIFIDGNHEYEAVKGDILASWPKLAEGGLFVFHDYRLYPNEFPGWDPGVTSAVNQLLRNGGELVSRHDMIAVVKPPREPNGHEK